jgi:hypothetical protein
MPSNVKMRAPSEDFLYKSLRGTQTQDGTVTLSFVLRQKNMLITLILVMKYVATAKLVRLPLIL